MKQRLLYMLLIVILVPVLLFSVTKKKAPAVALLTWQTDYTLANETAAKYNIPILVDFTGSDWCIWCQKLDREVFSKKAFQDYAKKNVVLLKIDFPKSLPQTDAVKEANQALAKQFDIKGFPTVVLLKADGTEIARTGYVEGGAAKYVEHLKALLQKK
jgi:protein disulfide-isomerase